MPIQTQFPSTFFTPQRYPAFRSALANASTTPVNVAVIGDSITEGYNATDRPIQGYVGLLRTYYQAKYGDAGYGYVAPYCTGATYPYSWVYSGTWSNGAPSGEGYGPWNAVRWATGATNQATITILGDAFDIHYVRNSFTNSTWTYTVDGGPPISVVQTASASSIVYEVASITGLTYGGHTIQISAPVTNYVFLIGITAKRANSGVRVHNVGRNGQSASYGNQAEKTKWISRLAPSLTIIALTTNDFAGQTALSTYNTNLGRIIAQGKLTGDVLCIGANPRNVSLAIPQSSYHAQMQQLAAANNAGFIDFLALWVNNANQLANGWVSDGVHPTDAGHAEYRNTILAHLPG
jgi:lysophospholipase L1-like esterase